MRKVTLRIPTKIVADLGLVNPHFFRNNDALEVLHTFAAGNEVSQVIRIRRKNRLPPNSEIQRRRGELLGRYALRHFEVLERDEPRREVTALIARKVPKDLAAVLRELGAEIVPVSPFTVGPEETVVSFYAGEDRLATVYELLDEFRIPYTVQSVRAYRGDPGGLATLTERQRSLLELAFRLGYYETPARTSLERVAAIAGVSRAAVSKTLRRAESKLLAATLDRAR